MEIDQRAHQRHFGQIGADRRIGRASSDDLRVGENIDLGAPVLAQANHQQKLEVEPGKDREMIQQIDENPFDHATVAANRRHFRVDAAENADRRAPPFAHHLRRLERDAVEVHRFAARFERHTLLIGLMSPA